MENKMERFMEKTTHVSQFVMACMMFLCLALLVAANIIRGHIASVSGYLVSLVFLALAWSLVPFSYKEMRDFGKKQRP